MSFEYKAVIHHIPGLTSEYERMNPDKVIHDVNEMPFEVTVDLLKRGINPLMESIRKMEDNNMREYHNDPAKQTVDFSKVSMCKARKVNKNSITNKRHNDIYKIINFCLDNGIAFNVDEKGKLNTQDICIKLIGMLKDKK